MTLGRSLYEHEIEAIRLLLPWYGPTVMASAMVDAGDVDRYASAWEWQQEVARRAAWHALLMRHGGRYRLD